VNYHHHYKCYHQPCWCIQSVTFHIPVDTLLFSRYHLYGITVCCTLGGPPPPLCSLLMKLIVLLCFFPFFPDFAFVLTFYSCILVFSIGHCGVSCLVNNDELNIVPEGQECTGLFISPSRTSELDFATTKTYTAERSTSIVRESLKVFCTRGLGVLAGSTARG